MQRCQPGRSTLDVGCAREAAQPAASATPGQTQWRRSWPQPAAAPPPTFATSHSNSPGWSTPSLGEKSCTKHRIFLLRKVSKIGDKVCFFFSTKLTKTADKNTFLYEKWRGKAQSQKKSVREVDPGPSPPPGPEGGGVGPLPCTNQRSLDTWPPSQRFSRTLWHHPAHPPDVADSQTGGRRRAWLGRRAWSAGCRRRARSTSRGAGRGRRGTSGRGQGPARAGHSGYTEVQAR